MTSPEEYPGLRDQFEVVVGSLENILNELQGVAADLKVVVNQIDDVTSQIENSHTSPVKSKVNRSLSSTQFNSPDDNSVGAIDRHKQRVSMDSGIQDVVSTPDYVNINALHLELSSILGPKFRNSSQTTLKKRCSLDSDQTMSQQNTSANMSHKSIKAKQDKYETQNKLPSDTARIVKPKLCDKQKTTALGINKLCPLRLESNKPKQLKPASHFSQEIYARIVRKKREQERNKYSQQSSVSIISNTKDKGKNLVHNGSTSSYSSSYRSRLRQDPVSDIYERRFEEQVESLELDLSDDEIHQDWRYVSARKGWSSSSAISDPIDLSQNLLEEVRFDDDTAYETDDNTSDISVASSYSRVLGMKPSDTFKYKVRQQLAPRRNSSGPSWRVVIEP